MKISEQVSGDRLLNKGNDEIEIENHMINIIIINIYNRINLLILI